MGRMGGWERGGGDVQGKVSLSHPVLRPVRRYRVLIAFLQIFILVNDKMDTQMRGCTRPHYNDAAMRMALRLFHAGIPSHHAL
jgi:hypothetical protein